jgi:TPR repeat protein
VIPISAFFIRIILLIRRSAAAHEAPQLGQPLLCREDAKQPRWHLPAREGIKQDFKEALKWYLLAAEQGSAVGQYGLGRMYSIGFAPGTTEIEDLMHSYMWMNLGASNLLGEEGREAANRRDDVAKRLIPAQLAQAQEMTKQCQERNFKNCD